VGTVTFSPRQHEILGALGRIILREGFDDLTVAVLADRLRCSRRTLYTLAPSRDDLIVSVVQDMFTSWMQRAQGAVAEQEDDVDAVVAFLAAGLEVGDATARFFAAVANHPDTARIHAQFKRDYMSALIQLVERAVPPSKRRSQGVSVTAEVLAAVVRRLAQLTHAPEAPLAEVDAIRMLDELVRGWLGAG
jgi:AcrR family transcriptional regulator